MPPLSYEEIRDVINTILTKDSQKELDHIDQNILKGTCDKLEYEEIAETYRIHNTQGYKDNGKKLFDRINRALRNSGSRRLKVNKSNVVDRITLYAEILNSQVLDPQRSTPILDQTWEIPEIDGATEKLVVDLNTNLKNIIEYILNFNSHTSRRSLKILDNCKKLFGGDLIIVVIVQTGRFRIILRGREEDINRITYKMQSGELRKINGFRIESYKLSDEETVVLFSRQRALLKWLVRQVARIIRLLRRITIQVARTIMYSPRWLVSEDFKNILLVTALVVAVVLTSRAVLANWDSIVSKTKETIKSTTEEIRENLDSPPRPISPPIRRFPRRF
ncbi:hypothetical protein [Aliterella atlantica]|uniref:vWA-MoxR associated protein N-terminal HTH domain-containing protein n=2 Tax=Aliterella TaxID=1827277 RepID=A0A0D8ZM58_9CYAN|nr:hypothetical protein [Aliterella atlantica]KJH69820.1 hypothetical protein UH38_21540 [Aliterella atlantica CENA595]